MKEAGARIFKKVGELEFEIHKISKQDDSCLLGKNHEKSKIDNFGLQDVELQIQTF